MGETAQILALWRRAQAQGERVCLATVVHVEGSSYRKPGARMLLTSGGERAGTVSGGCLEAEVSRKAWWLTANGASVEQYASSFDEDGAAWGLGCGGVVSLLLEQQPETVLEALRVSLEEGRPAVVVSRLLSPAGTVAVLRENASLPETLPKDLQALVGQAWRERRSFLFEDAGIPAAFVEYLAPPPRLTIFGAGDDARPIAEFAQALGWRIAVADGRSHLLRPERFPAGATLRLLQYESEALACAAGSSALPSASGNGSPKAGSSAPNHAMAAPPRTGLETGVAPRELAVVLTHSYEQDRALLAALLPEDLLYLGILGPRHRTTRLLEEIAPALGSTVEQCFQRLHAPVGLDLGARDPAAIALSIVAEMQAVLAGRQVSVSRAPAPAPVHAHA